MNRIEAAIKHYKREYSENKNGELKWFRDQPNLQDAIKSAALALNEKGKRYHHQRRLTKSNLLQARAILLGLQNEILQVSTFDDLYKLIEEFILPINGLGPLYVYDTALRIGSYLGLLPEFVYLHAGTLIGARNLGLNIKANRIKVKDLPMEFHSLEAIEVEDILCIYKDLLKYA